MKPEPAFTTSGFFVLRTPLLPFDTFTAWGEGADAATLRQRLQLIIDRPEVREALFVASPSLSESLAVWREAPESERGQKVERALIRYFTRMCTRSTPFGLFAGCGVGRVEGEPSLVVEGREHYLRRTRLDSDYLAGLADALSKDPAVRARLSYRPNNSLYAAGGRARYAEARLGGEGDRQYHLVAFEPQEAIDVVLARAAQGARLDDLAETLVDADTSREEARAFVDELVTTQILLPELGVKVTGGDGLDQLLSDLGELGGDAAAALERTRGALRALDEGGLGQGPEAYQALARDLAALPAEVDAARLVQVDMAKPAPRAQLGEAPLREIVRAVELLRRISPATPDAGLDAFRTAFRRRYDDQEVPLALALDEECGVGFGSSGGTAAETSPLLRGLHFPGPDADESGNWQGRHSFLLRKLGPLLARGARQLELDEETLRALEVSAPMTLPDAFAASAVVAAAGPEALRAGDFRVHFQGTMGPSGAIMLGRFCHIDPALAQAVQAHVRLEEAHRPDAVFAEVVHLPEGRIGNVLTRPALRGYEIPFLGRSSLPPDRQIPIDDLLVSLRGGRVVLRSRRLQREVLPRLTSAHNYTNPRNLVVYRFLCALQRQGVAAGLGWSWGPLQGAEFLPRVVSGRLVLSLARWNVTADRLRPLAEASEDDLPARVRSLRDALGLPRLVALEDGDNVMVVDLENILGVRNFVQLVGRRTVARLTEVFPGPGELCVSGPEGLFRHELVVPLVSTAAPVRTAAPAVSPSAGRRTFAPGSEWLYLKLFTGTATADRVLREAVAPVVRQALASGAATGWFFLRFDEGGHHLRVRLRGEPARLYGEVLSAFERAGRQLLDEGSGWGLQLDTYQREVERYGGEVGVALAERLFRADSDAVLELVERYPGDQGADLRWRLALAGSDALLDDLGLELAAKHEVMQEMRRQFSQEFRAGTSLTRQIADRFRVERGALDRLLGRGDGALAEGLEILRRRSEALAPVVRELGEAEAEGRLTTPVRQLAPSYLHMHVNRAIRSSQRAHELVLYDFLARLYEGRLARARKAAAG
jgi:thiopeptide-type bacteriocin biosynthesis protein